MTSRQRECKALLWKSATALLQGKLARGWRLLMSAYDVHPAFMAGYAEGQEGLARNNANGESDCYGAPAKLLLRKLDSILQPRPRRAIARAWRAALLRRLLRYEEAADDLRVAAEEGLRTAPVLSWLGEAKLQLGDASGFTELNQAISRRCRSWNHAWLGRALVAFRRDRRALKHLDDAIALDPSNGWFLAWRGEAKRLLGVHRGMLADLDKALRLDPGFNYHPFVYAWRGLAKVGLGRHEKALADFNRCLNQLPSYALALQGRAQAHRALKQWSRWLEDFDRAAELDEKYISRLYSQPRGRLEELLADIDRCTSPAQRILRLKWRGLVLGLLGRRGAAATTLKRAVASRPGAFWPRVWLGQLQAQSDPRNALRCFDRSLSIDPRHALAYAWRSKLHLELGEPGKALSDLDRAIALDGRQSFFYGERGCLRLLLNDVAGGVRDLRRATVADGKNAAALADLSVAYERANDPAAAGQVRERALRLDASAAGERLRVWAVLQESSE